MTEQHSHEANSDSDTTVCEIRRVTELFHQVNRVLPVDQKLLTFPPDLPARDAVSQLAARGFSQAPVIEGGTVLGVFSFRSFARYAASFDLKELNQQRLSPGDSSVDECLEHFAFALVTNEMHEVFDAMDRDNGVLIGTPQSLQGVLTPMDFLRYLYDVAGPFVFVSEIELALRALIGLSLKPGDLELFAKRSLLNLYSTPENVPTSLEQMTFDNYRQMIIHSENWPAFEPLLGANRARVGAKLKDIADLRNVLFHFKRDVTRDDREALVSYRNWLLVKAKKADFRGAGNGSVT